MVWNPCNRFFFFFNDTATTEIYTLSLHDALPISCSRCPGSIAARSSPFATVRAGTSTSTDRKSTRLNSSHLVISYAVFCLKKKKTQSLSHVSVSLVRDLVLAMYAWQARRCRDDIG